ncbi:MAG: hypothetical protein ACK4TN_01310 [Brevinematales bacterium]
MQDSEIQGVLDLISEVRSLFAKRRKIFEQFLLSFSMRVLIGLLGCFFTIVGVWLVFDPEGFVKLWFSSLWIWVVIGVLVVVGGGMLKFQAWKNLSFDRSPFQSLFEVIGRSLLIVDGIGVIVFLVLHVWIMLQGNCWYLFSLWAVGVGFVYVMYGAFLSVWFLLAIGIWSVCGGLLALFWVPQTLRGVGLAFLVVFGFSYVGLFVFLEILARLRKKGW